MILISGNSITINSEISYRCKPVHIGWGEPLYFHTLTPSDQEVEVYLGKQKVETIEKLNGNRFFKITNDLNGLFDADVTVKLGESFYASNRVKFYPKPEEFVEDI
ncbi:MAG: hypothetical protein LW832_10380 [Parachlamydia sp.]|jgi:hypothetical protein|nr:hypothetical protein [Parachlamydia sp.]